MSEELVIRTTRRLPRPVGPPGDGRAAARQLDVALASVGFKLSAALLGALSALDPATVVDAGRRLLDVVRSMVGDHVRHNAYFRDFPAGVPDTVEFWAACVRDALDDASSRDAVSRQLSTGVVNLLDLPSYGRYQHDYADLLAAHEQLIPLVSDRVTVIELGGPSADEEHELYLTLAASPTPLAPDELVALRELSAACADGPQPQVLPMRENRAVVNEVRLDRGRAPIVDTVTDVLRLACALSGGDVTLTEPTRFRSLRRPERRALLAALDVVVGADPAKLGDVDLHREAWKRLGERLHPHEYPRYPRAADVFATARREKRVPSLTARVESALARDDLPRALGLYGTAPGRLFRALDRVLRVASTDAERELVVRVAEDRMPDVSGRVLLSVREHLTDRTGRRPGRRIFTNRVGRSFVTDDERTALDTGTVRRLISAIDVEVARRLPRIAHLVVDRDVLDVALPLSAKAMPAGVGLLPRGSVTAVEGRLLRFFVYWRESAETTDFDLSALLLDEELDNPDWLSYTNLRTVGGRHSGDIVAAPNGATEFIDLDLGTLRRAVVVPQVNVYSGEGFDQVAESFFGFMLRTSEQKGMPFEPRTVRTKSDLRGSSRVALPLAFVRSAGGAWRAHWLHLFLRGAPAFNQVETNRVSTAELVRATLDREYLTVRFLVDLLEPARLTVLEPGEARPVGEHTHLGLDSLSVLRSLVPD